MTLSRKSTAQAPFVLRAYYDETSPRFWRRLWIASGSPVVTAAEKAHIRRTIGKIGLDALDPKALALLDFVANFVEPNEAVPEFDSLTESILFKEEPKEDQFTMICHLVGKPHVGTYTANEKTVVSSAIVGDPDSRCRGRCGIGCYQFMQWRPHQYTQECFEHDICHHEVGSMLGACSDSFWKAYYGYMNAPNCDFEKEKKTRQVRRTPVNIKK